MFAKICYFTFQKAKQLKQKKEEGNGAFKSGKLEDAYTLYTEALQIDPFNKYTNAKLLEERRPARSDWIN